MKNTYVCVCVFLSACKKELNSREEGEKTKIYTAQTSRKTKGETEEEKKRFIQFKQTHVRHAAFLRSCQKWCLRHQRPPSSLSLSLPLRYYIFSFLLSCAFYPRFTYSFGRASSSGWLRLLSATTGSCATSRLSPSAGSWFVSSSSSSSSDRTRCFSASSSFCTSA